MLMHVNALYESRFANRNKMGVFLVYLHHIVVSKTTLACNAAYNALLDQPVNNKLLQHECRQTATDQIFSTY